MQDLSLYQITNAFPMLIAQEEMTEDELSSLDRFFDDPDGAKSDMESKPSVDEVENG